MSNISKNIRDVLSREKSDKGLARLEDDFFSSAYAHLNMFKGGWQGMTRGDSEVERSYRNWKITKANIRDIFISRLRKILTMVNQKIDGRNPNLGRLVPEEKTLFLALAFIAMKSKKIIVERSTSERGVLEDIIYLMRSDPDGNELFDLEKPFLRGHSFIAEDKPSPEEFTASPDHERKPDDNEYLTDFDSYTPPEEETEPGEESVIVPYEEYYGKDLGEGDLEAGPDPVKIEEIQGGIEAGTTNDDVDGKDNGEDDDKDNDKDNGEENVDEHDKDETDIGIASQVNPMDEKRALLVRILEDTGSFISEDGNIYNLKKNEIISFPYNVANILVEAEKAEPIE